MPLVAIAAFGPRPASGAVNVELRARSGVVDQNATLALDLVLSPVSMDTDTVAAAQIIFAWDPAALRLVGLDGAAAAASLLQSSLPDPDPYGLNELPVPQDGDAIYVALAPLGAPVQPPPGGVILTTLLFEPAGSLGSTSIDILPQAGDPIGRTRVYDGGQANQDILAGATGATVTIVPCPGAAALGASLGALVCASRRRRAGGRGA